MFIRGVSKLGDPLYNFYSEMKNFMTSAAFVIKMSENVN